MSCCRLLVTLCAVTLIGPIAPVSAADVTVPSDGRVVIELLGADAGFRNTLSVTAPGVAVALSGCSLEPADGLTGVLILSERNSQRGCRVELDADPATDGIQPFAANTTLRFGFCAQTDADDACVSTCGPATRQPTATARTTCARRKSCRVRTA